MNKYEHLQRKCSIVWHFHVGYFTSQFCQLSSPGPFTIKYLTLGLLSSLWNIYHSTTAYCFLTHPVLRATFPSTVTLITSRWRILSKYRRAGLLSLPAACSYLFYMLSTVWWWVVGCWHGYLSGARCRLAYGPADATATYCLLLQ